MSRPREWTIAAPDLNVLLSGRFVADSSASSQDDAADTVEFELAPDGLYIHHAALISVTCHPTTQVLASLNTGKPILTLETPLFKEQTEDQAIDDDYDEQDHQNGAMTGTSSTTRRQQQQPPAMIVKLHKPFLTREQATSKQNLPVYSNTFEILLDGLGWLPPKFDPQNLTPATPSVTGSSHILNSPTVQRALLSPLLSPQRRAASQGSDASVPPLNLGVSRARAPSLSGSSQPPPHSSLSTAQARAHQDASSSLGNPNRRGSNTNERSLSRQRRALNRNDLTTLVEPVGRPSLDQVMTSDVSSRAKSTAEEILNLRRQHDAYVKRVKAELEVLTTRVSNAANAVSTTIAPGSGLVVRGFGAGQSAANSASPSKSRSPADHRRESKSSSLDRSVDGSGIGEDQLQQQQQHSRGESRGRARGRQAGKATGADTLDEQKSQEIRDEDERQEEERGRSRSRVRRTRDGEPDQRSHGSTSKSRDKVAEVVAAVAASAAHSTSSSAPATSNASATGLRAGDSVPAVVDDEDESDQPDADAASKEASSSTAFARSAPASSSSAGQVNTERIATPLFVPSSHALVSIPETEELSLPPSETGGDRTPDTRPSPKRTTDNKDRQIESDEESEHEAPFEMDEDIDDDEMELDQASANPIDDLSGELNADNEPTAQASQQQQSNTFYPGSFRPSTLSSSYAALLNASSTRQTAPTTASSYRSPSMASFKPAPMFDQHGHGQSRNRALSPTQDYSPEGVLHPTSTSAKDDARVELAYVPKPDPKLAREGASKIREVLAMDAPSHRAPLPSRRRRTSRQNLDSQDGVSDGDDLVDDAKEDAKYSAGANQSAVVGSLPISIGFARPTSSTFRPPSERELERKTSVPSREGMFVVPLLRQEARRRSLQQAQHSSTSSLTGAVSTGIAIHGTGVEGSPEMAIRNSSHATGNPSSLAQSLRQHPSNVRSFQQVVEEEDEADDVVDASDQKRSGLHPSLDQPGSTGLARDRRSSLGDRKVSDAAQGDSGGREGQDDDDEDFVPPHLMLKQQRRTDEQFLSRSVQSDE
ncbi:hypothetical protein OIO90_005165 [Microbotryomycetes sp. JL221]|nr:hypothetical protein OIO90_005165 [Microbotryomycetes sp. JL221]